MTLLDVFHEELVFPLVSIPFVGNVMEQNPIGFPKLMFLHVGPYAPYFGSSYGGIGSALVMWFPISNPLVNMITPFKPILGVA